MRTASVTVGKSHLRKFAVACAILLAVLAILFVRSFFPGQVIFSNDGPLGAMIAEQNRMPAIMTGLWQDLNWLGNEVPSPSPNISCALRLILPPVEYSKFFCPITLFMLGLCAWYCFRQWKLSPPACLLGALATTLSSHFLSTACWGVATQVICVGMSFLAVGLLSSPNGRYWVKLVLAGMVVGLGVMEGYDIGALFSLFVAAFLVYTRLVEEGRPSKKLPLAIAQLSIIALAAAFLAAHTLSTLIGTQIKGVVGTEQTPEAKARGWDFATQWSLPPGELPQLFISGVFGYRMDTPTDMGAFPDWFEGGVYWGAIGRSPGLDKAIDAYVASGRQGQPPQGMFRLSGGGEYAGVLVLALALWAVLQSWRKKDSVFSLLQRKYIWFWTGAALVSMLLSFGRYAPFYQLFYALPFASTIRNATKFTHPFHWSLVILFAYGVHGLYRRYLEPSTVPIQGLGGHLKNWWSKANPFDKRWTKFSLGAIAASLLGWLVYASSRPSLEKLLKDVGFPDPTQAAQIAGFSIHAVGGFVLVLLITVGLLTLIFSGWFSGRRARMAGVLLGLLLVIDLARADLPWIIYWNYPEKYATNPVIDFLRSKPYLQRVAIFPLERFIQSDRLPSALVPLVNSYLQLRSFYHEEWKQQHFPYYNIQCLDVIQLPRVPVDYQAFETALSGAPLRHWELTNTRYLLGPAALLATLNQQLDPGLRRFRIAAAFDIVQKPGAPYSAPWEKVTAVLNTNGQFAVFEFAGVLDRARLYTNWQVNTNDQATLDRLAAPGFDPAQTVLVANSIPDAANLATNQNPGTVEFVSYAPKHLVLRAKAVASSVLLLNDKYDPNWKVSVDGKPATLLRCNYIMQGAQVPAGEHTIDLRFEPPITWLYVSLSAVVILLGLLVLLAIPCRVEAPGAAQQKSLTQSTVATKRG